jgi:hypothetical protein
VDCGAASEREIGDGSSAAGLLGVMVGIVVVAQTLRAFAAICAIFKVTRIDPAVVFSR